MKNLSNLCVCKTVLFFHGALDENKCRNCVNDKTGTGGEDEKRKTVKEIQTKEKNKRKPKTKQQNQRNAKPNWGKETDHACRRSESIIDPKSMNEKMNDQMNVEGSM